MCIFLHNKGSNDQNYFVHQTALLGVFKHHRLFFNVIFKIRLLKVLEEKNFLLVMKMAFDSL